MKPPFPKTHSMTVNHPLEVFCFLTMDCGHQMGQGEVVWDPTDANPDAERPDISCTDCRTAARQIERKPGQKDWEYGCVDKRELRNWLEWRGVAS